jgi:hypothetical protein
MLKFERRLLNPPAAEVAAALGAAYQEANRRIRTGRQPDDPQLWQELARVAAGRPEGWDLQAKRRSGLPSTAVFLAWWTDAVGRKHVRVTGYRAEAPEWLDAQVLGEWPPLWHVFPERVYRVGAEGRLLVVCECGLAGSPAELAWAGPCCGACHDFREEHGRPRFPSPALLTGERELIRAVCLDPTGRFVAGCEWNGRLLVWDREAGAEPVRVVAGFQISAYLLIPQLALTAGATHLLAGGNGALTLHCFDLRDAAAPQRSPPGHAGPFALAGGEVLYAGPREVFVCPVEHPESHHAVFPIASGWTMAVSPNGQTVAAIHEDLTVFERPGGSVRFRRALPTAFPPQRDSPHSPQPLAAFSPDGSRLAVAHGAGVEVLDTTTGQPVGSGEQPATVTGMGFAGGRLFSARRDGVLLAADPTSPATGLTLRWHLGPISALAVTPDGSALATAGADGVKLWPVGPLLTASA